MAINAKGVFLGCKYALIQMLKQTRLPGVKDLGWIVNTASVQGLVAYHNTPAYTASKGAVAQLTKQVALDYAPHRIHCNAICPGFLKTTMTQNLQNDPVKQAEIDAAHPFGGMGSPEDVAKAVLFLASDDCGMNSSCLAKCSEVCVLTELISLGHWRESSRRWWLHDHVREYELEVHQSSFISRDQPLPSLAE